MLETDQLSYKIKKYEQLAAVDGLRVSILTLAAGEEVPWHRHSHIDDDFFCMEGPMQVETRAPRDTTILHLGETLKVSAGEPHRVSGLDGGACRFLLVQGIGSYDFILV